MPLKVKRSWELPESAATPEHVYWSRRHLIRAAAAGPILAAGGGLLAAWDDEMNPIGRARAAEAADPSAHLYPVKRNPAYTLDRPLTDEKIVSTYNNYYEFGSSKNIAREAQDLAIRPWMVKIDGMVEKPITIGIDELLAKMPLEERLYRHRCVEAWSITVPWSGFPLASLVKLARPSSGAAYLKMTAFEKPDVAIGQKATWYPWPYVEGLTVAEATNQLAFISTGMYGKPIPKQNGCPLRLTVPWKYGFKSVKGIVRFTFTDKRPKTFWEEILPAEYGFWANVNPDVPHPRWSQATERFLGTNERMPTLLYNGYAEQVAGLYTNLQNEKLFM
jgi:sulfoxide reductase catalytic subunit YedY